MSDFNRVHDCILDFVGIKPTDEQTKEIFMMLPDYIISEAVEYGLSDSVFADSISEWLEVKKEKLKKEVFTDQ